VSPFGEVAGEIGLPNTDEDYIAIPQQARRINDHQLGG
jgi:hypothetical protein